MPASGAGPGVIAQQAPAARVGSSPRCGVFFDPHTVTSGRRFFAALHAALEPVIVPLGQRPDVILFNVSAPLGQIVRARLRGQKVVLRVDGLYMDRLSEPFLETLAGPVRAVLRQGAARRGWHDACAFFANLLNRNYAAFARLLYADVIIYQSRFSQALYSRYFPRKRSHVILNGAIADPTPPRAGSGDEIRLVTIHDDWRPSKRTHDVVGFVIWARERMGVPLHLTIVGYNGTLPRCVPPDTRHSIERADYIRCLPKFSDFTGPHGDALRNGDIYLTFTYRDACPNAVVEAMAHGLPVVGIASGGVTEIVGDAGELVPNDDFAQGFYSSHRYECAFPDVDYTRVLEATLRVAARLDEYRARVQARFDAELNIAHVAQRYLAAMQAAAAAS